VVAVAVGVLVVVGWTRAEAGTVTPRIFCAPFVPLAPVAASAVAGESRAIRARIAPHEIVLARHRL
jgi:hypothetical protein